MWGAVSRTKQEGGGRILARQGHGHSMDESNTFLAACGYRPAPEGGMEMREPTTCPLDSCTNQTNFKAKVTLRTHLVNKRRNWTSMLRRSIPTF